MTFTQTVHVEFLNAILLRFVFSKTFDYIDSNSYRCALKNVIPLFLIEINQQEGTHKQEKAIERTSSFLIIIKRELSSAQVK